MKRKILTLGAIFLITILSISAFNPYKGKRYHHQVERPIMVEKWMTEPFTSTVEEPLELEDWMCEPFNWLSK